MTIITKPISEKKGEKLSVPLVENDQLASAVSYLLICFYLQWLRGIRKRCLLLGRKSNNIALKCDVAV